MKETNTFRLHSSQLRLKLLAQSKVINVLNKLNLEKFGCTFSEIQFSLRINPSILSPILKKLVYFNYVFKQNGKYTITWEGKGAFKTCLELSSLGSKTKSFSYKHNDKNMSESCKIRGSELD